MFTLVDHFNQNKLFLTLGYSMKGASGFSYFRLQLKLTRTVIVGALLCLALAGCLPQFGTPTDPSSRSTGLSSATSTTSSSGDYCSRFDPANPEYAYCVDCSRTLIAERCQPGVSTVTSCLDASFRRNYTQLVNQCISQSATAGRLCSLTCPAGQVVDARVCRCVSSSSSSAGTGGAGLSSIDSGQYDVGPPVVQLYWDRNKFKSEYVRAASRVSGTMTGLSFEVRNRGGTHPRDNQNTVVESFCEDSYTAAGTGIGSVGVLLSNTGNSLAAGTNISAGFTVSTGGYTYNRRSYFFDPEKIPVPSATVFPYYLPAIISNPFVRNYVPLTGYTSLRDTAYVYKSNSLGLYVAGGSTFTNGRGDTEVNGFGVNLTKEINSGWGADYNNNSARYPNAAAQQYSLTTDLLFLDGWTGGDEKIDLAFGGSFDGTASVPDSAAGTSILYDPPSAAPWVYLAAPANEMNASDSYIPSISNGAVDGFSSYSLSIQHQRDGRNLESTYQTCDYGLNPTCAADSRARITLSGPTLADGLVLRYKRSSNLASSNEHRVGLDYVKVEPLNGAPRCSIKYQFRDSNFQSSYYCLNFAVKTTCGRRTDDATSGCGLEVDTSAGSEAGNRLGFFAAGVSDRCMCTPFVVWDGDFDADGVPILVDTCCTPYDYSDPFGGPPDGIIQDAIDFGTGVGGDRCLPGSRIL